MVKFGAMALITEAQLNMANLNEEPVWEEGIYQFETTDPVEGGPEGIDNKPTRQLANRTAYLKKEQDKLKDKFDAEKTPNPLPQYVKLSCFTGLIGEFHTAGQVPGWIDLKGGTLSRVTDKLLWEYALSSEMIIAQALKDADPVKYAMFFGDGDGSTSFTLPNHHLGHFTRGTPSAQTHGSTQNDALRNAYGSFSIDARKGIEPQGGFSFPGDSGLFVGGSLKSGSVITSSDYGGGLNYQSVHFDLSRVLPTSNEIRPFTANISIKIHRGWM